MNTILTIIAIICMIIGFFGVFFPIIPGTGLIFIVTFIYALLTNFKDITLTTVIIFAILTSFSFVFDYLASIITTKKVGASTKGIIGMCLGAIIGFFLFNIIGLIIGQFIGAIIGELLSNNKFKKSVNIGLATFIGYLLGIVFDSIIASIIIFVFIIKVLI
ncbi:MAG: DUF456 domain-containing protein [Firmicutes bacterium]|nr:DUF456 domain-containing protein [Bacillota bacterium]